MVMGKNNPNFFEMKKHEKKKKEKLAKREREALG